MIDEVTLNVKLARHEKSIKRLRKWCKVLEDAHMAHQRVHTASAQNTLSMSPDEPPPTAEDDSDG